VCRLDRQGRARPTWNSLTRAKVVAGGCVKENLDEWLTYVQTGRNEGYPLTPAELGAQALFFGQVRPPRSTAAHRITPLRWSTQDQTFNQLAPP